MREGGYVHHWHWEELEGQIVIYRDRQPIFYSPLNVAMGGPMHTIKQLLDNRSEGHFGYWTANERDALQHLFEFTQDHNLELGDLAKWMVEALNLAEQNRDADKPVLDFARRR